MKFAEFKRRSEKLGYISDAEGRYKKAQPWEISANIHAEKRLRDAKIKGYDQVYGTEIGNRGLYELDLAKKRSASGKGSLNINQQLPAIYNTGRAKNKNLRTAVDNRRQRVQNPKVVEGFTTNRKPQPEQTTTRPMATNTSTKPPSASIPSKPINQVTENTGATVKKIKGKAGLIGAGVIGGLGLVGGGAYLYNRNKRNYTKKKLNYWGSK